jgi:curved DNA-binding protein
MAVAFQDYYETLGVARDASADAIRRAYRNLARKHHPDVNKDSGAEDRFKDISEAYEVLRDPEKRQRYDRFGANWRAGQDVAGADGFDAGDVRFDFGGGDFSDFFEGLFGGRARAPDGSTTDGFEAFSMRGGDREAVLELTLEEAARGGKRRISLEDGREFDVETPHGVRDGQRIRLAGQGAPGIGGGPPGDLFLRARLRPHPVFDVEGRDLYVDLPISPWEAALGAEVPVPTLEGRARVRVPPGSSSGRQLRLRGQGLPDGGDLYAVLAIRVPETLDRKERKLFEQLADASTFDPRAT